MSPRDLLLQCCGSRRWAEEMAALWPFADNDALLAAADDIWWRCDAADWLEAFHCHPRIGEQRDGDARSAEEQAGMSRAGEATRRALAEANRQYEDRFGYIYLICASGKSGEEMLDTLRSRLTNQPDNEIRVAAEEQRKITRLRLQKMFAL
jgi:OHCU decarboxylase